MASTSSDIDSEIPDALPTQVIGQKLAGRVALVTGGTRGIGAAICRSLASQGAILAAGYSGDSERAAQFGEEFSSMFDPTRISLHKGNISLPDDCRRVVREVLDERGRVDILVNNAGITVDKTILKMTDDDWQRVLAVNLSGAFFMSQSVLGHMLDRGSGRIINLSSIVGEKGNIGQTNYAASKSGLFGLTKSMALETAFMLERAGKLNDGGPGLTINAVTPGVIATEMVQSIPAKVLERMTAQIPLRRLGDPVEIARVVHFLAADAASFVTGQVWGVNGGMDM